MGAASAHPERRPLLRGAQLWVGRVRVRAERGPRAAGHGRRVGENHKPTTRSPLVFMVYVYTVRACSEIALEQISEILSEP